MEFKTIKVRFQDSICFIKFYRPEANNTINLLLLEEVNRVLDYYTDEINIVVLEGIPEVFCFGADFHELISEKTENNNKGQAPEILYDFYLKLATGSFITISNVKGKVNAGGMGIVVASDIVFADDTAQFSLSEMLFGLFPACVLPFLIRKIGLNRSNYLTLTTKSIDVKEAYEYGLVNIIDNSNNQLLRRNLLRLKHLSKDSILEYKNYLNTLDDSIFKNRDIAILNNSKLFSNERNLNSIKRYIEEGKFYWED
ncbi:enoyl-CoA hydratase/isomerase [Clostridium beijerinckii]|uniref:Polyketide biosynthesis enoyl-CoA hydratase PksH n=1 Tax=Clostridium beijerinckii TaxID=1520 RepID=A0AAE5EXI8_CLOBE|nr:enoyl-CoA hydratase/isomerase [Clostridium beijerinckii]ALB48693.1 enoyl-CoA hydratase/isomerase [Clostridium beijerinckii NRRL B-598]NRT86789.1 polyketide biosynthesis enoyl-CoA hydratase PksH [Clostridium beijerinckii]NSB14154.1 polyketide biosynthesis enoyl-CoA hydratase PksH [Clostridium beijerinckii]NYC72221.1 polyketide biosynthesis enoyl-CoA hydratase PksH [Clostridium beijerinckii]